MNMKPCLFCLVTAVACAASSPGTSAPRRGSRITPLPCPPNGIDSATIRPLQDQPTPVTNGGPPMPIPADVRHHRAIIRVVVDTAGRVMPDSITICGLPNVGYTQRLAEVFAKTRFVGALNGAPVAGPTRIEWRF